MRLGEPTGAFFIGIGGPAAMLIGLEVLEYLPIDDPFGAVPVHMFPGIWGPSHLVCSALATTGCLLPTGQTTARFW